MPLTIYRYHSTDCKVHSFKLRPDAKRFFRDCDCKIWITGTTDTERYPRQSTGLRDWKAAEAYLLSLTVKSKDTTVHGETLADCIKKFIDAHEENVGAKALGQYKLTLDRLQAHCHSKNKFFIHELTVDLLEDFKTYGLPKLKSTSKATAVSKLKFFLREAYRRGWTKEALAEKVKSTKAIYEEKQPYTEEEVSLILAEADKLNGGTTGYATQPKTFRLLLDLMLETGMRVGDAIRYQPARCKKSKELWMYSFFPQKVKRNHKPKQLEVFLTQELKKAIDGCTWLSGSYPFAYREFEENTAMEAAVYERMQAIGERSGVSDCRPHRLRDTFAVRMLLKGVALEDVSHLLGHGSIAVTEKYYAAWVPSRKLRLEGLLSKALVNPVSD